MKALDMFRIEDRVAIVTGGAGLFGAHISEALCEAGATVVIASRDLDKCEKQAEQLKKKGYKALGMQVDLSDEKSINGFVDNVLREFRNIDILVNNAVSRYGLEDIENTTKEGWETAQNVNGLGLMLMTKSVIPQMLEQGKGNIINISSIQGVQGPFFPVYGDTGLTS